MSHTFVNRHSPLQRRMSRQDEALANSFELINEFPVAPAMSKSSPLANKEQNYAQTENFSEITSCASEDSFIMSVHSLPAFQSSRQKPDSRFESRSVVGGDEYEAFNDRSSYRGFYSPAKKMDALNFSMKSGSCPNNNKSIDPSDQNDDYTTVSMNDSPRRGPNPLEQATQMKEAFTTEKTRAKKLRIQLKALDKRLSDSNQTVSKLKSMQKHSNKKITKLSAEVDSLTKKLVKRSQQNKELGEMKSVLENKLSESQTRVRAFSRDNEELAHELEEKTRLLEEQTKKNIKIVSKLEELEDEITMLNVERLEFKDILAQHQQIVKVLKSDLEKKTAIIKEMQKLLDSYVQECDEKERLLKESALKVQMLEIENSKKSSENKYLENTLQMSDKMWDNLIKNVQFSNIKAMQDLHF